MRKLSFILVVLLLPMKVFAGGAIVPYVEGWVSAPTNAELDRMTHLMIFQLFPDGSGNFPSNLNFLPNWTTTTIQAAQAKSVKVCIAVGGASASYTPAFVTATNSTNRPRLVDNIVSLVNQYGLDGIDLDWEFPKSDAEWQQYVDLIVDLKNRMPDKRISVAIGGDSPSSQYGNHFMRENSGVREYVRQRIFYADAIHLMTYDMAGVSGWITHHSDENGTIRCLEQWDEWGRGAGHGANGLGVAARYDKEKLFAGIAPYAAQGTRADTQQEAVNKVRRTYEFGGGGVIMWALGGSRKSDFSGFLQAMWDENNRLGGYTTGIGDTGKTNAKEVTIYPNPVKDELRIESGELKIENVGIYDLSGKKLLTFNVSIFNVSALSQGIYFIKIETDNGIVIKKMVKE